MSQKRYECVGGIIGELVAKGVEIQKKRWWDIGGMCFLGDLNELYWNNVVIPSSDRYFAAQETKDGQ